MPVSARKHTAVSRAVIRKARKRRRTMVSGLEKLVRGWLDNAGIEYKTQYPVGWCHVDLLLGADLIVEINGCYWHKCPECYPENTKAHVKKRAQDRKRYRYFLNRGYRLMLLWEHNLKPKDEAATVAKLVEQL